MSVAKSEKISVALAQLTSTDDFAANLTRILDLLSSIRKPEEVDLICLPENALFMRVTEGTSIPSLDLQSEMIGRLSEWSKNFGPALHIGSVPLQEGGDESRLVNASVLIMPDGDAQVVYRKIHLFDVDVQGHRPIRESDVFAPGVSPATFSLKGWSFGCSICYDLRFAELFLNYARQGVDVLLVPAAFLVATGRAHWSILLRARAIESQAFVLAAAQGGTHQGHGERTRQTFGCSMVVDPWGTVLSQGPEEVGGVLIFSELHRDRLEQVRRQIPMGQHRCLP